MKLGANFKFSGWVKKDSLFVPFWFSEEHNLETNEGLTDSQTQYFKGVAYTAAFYIGLIDNDHFGSLQTTDTAAKITTANPGGGTNQWKENTGYSQATRPVWTPGNSVSGSIDNSASPAIFSVTAGFTLNGAFLATNNVKGGVAGKLFGEASAAMATPFANGQQIQIIVQCTWTN